MAESLQSLWTQLEPHVSRGSRVIAKALLAKAITQRDSSPPGAALLSACESVLQAADRLQIKSTAPAGREALQLLKEAVADEQIRQSLHKQSFNLSFNQVDRTRVPALSRS